MVQPADSYDVFFSYHWRDQASVEAVAQALSQQGLKVFLDRWYLLPGRPWPQVLEEVIAFCRSVAVFVGPYGMGPWQQREKNLAISRQTSPGNSCPAAQGRPRPGLPVSAFSPDGKTLASGNFDDTIILWDVARGRPLGAPLKGHQGPVNSVAFSPDGKTLASGSEDGTIILWDVDVKFWIKRACYIANRNITREEWRRYIGDDVPYRKTCPNLPGPED